MHDTELTAYLWLLALPRITQFPPKACAPKIREMVDRQVKISICPGELHANQGAPGVHVSVLLPGKFERISGQGNDLYTACDRLCHSAWKQGVQLQFPSVFHRERQRDPSLKKPTLTP